MNIPENDPAREPETLDAGPAHVPGGTASPGGPPAEIAARDTAAGAIDAGPAPSAPATAGPPPFAGVAPALATGGEKPASEAPGDLAAGPAPDVPPEGNRE